MAWPSGTKAGTTNVDAGTDKPSLARADIKQNIDNVNSIIDEFNIASPSDGDILQYNASPAQWESVPSSTAIPSINVAFATHRTGDTLVPATGGSADRKIPFTEQVDAGAILSISSGDFTLAGSGTFVIQLGIFDIADTGTGAYLHDETGTADLYKITADTTNNHIGGQTYVVTQSSNNTYSILIKASTSTTTTNSLDAGELTLVITKL